MIAVYKYIREVNTKEGKELLKQKAGLAQEQMDINWSLINIVRKLEDVFQPPEQRSSSETGFQRQGRQKGLRLACTVLGQFLAGMACPQSGGPNSEPREIPASPTFICRCKYFVTSEGGRKKAGKL